MIKLPKEVVMQLVEELTNLVAKQEASEQIKSVVQGNLQIQAEIDKRQEHIKALTREVEELTAKLVEVPEYDGPYEERIEDLSQMLLLSGYFKKVVVGDEEYLEETGLYEEKFVKTEEPVVEENLEETIEEEVVSEPTAVVEEV